MKVKFIISSIVFILFFFLNAFAETSIKAEVDKTKISTEETLTYKITINASNKKLPAPQIPKFAGFNVISQAQSSTMSFAKANLKTIIVYAFILAPTDIGKFNIEPSSLRIKNKIYSTESFEIEVTQGKRKSRIPQKGKPPLPKETQPESEEPQVTL